MSSVRLAALAALVGCASLWSAVGHAQVFRVVGPDGRVTFTDRPPVDTKASPAPTVSMAGSSGGSSSASLPATVRNAMSRFPVTLYSSTDCTPCVTARTYLTSRGIPFTERTIATNDDVAALQRLAGETGLPFATIGGQHVRGFSDAEWGQYLDAAGYPKASQLPSSWRNPAPAPLVAVQAPAVTAPPQAQQQARPPQSAGAGATPAPAPSDPSPSNPAGIRF